MSRRLGFVVATVLLLPATLPAQHVRQQGDRSSAARAAIERAWATVAERAKSGDAAAVAALYTSDAMLMDGTAPTVRGRAALEQAFREMFKASRFVGMTHEQATLEVDGDIAIETGIISPTWQENGKPPSTISERYTVIWKRVGGNWLVHRDIGVPLPAARDQSGTGFTDATRAAIADTITSLGKAAFAAGTAKDLDLLFSFFDPAVSFLDEGNWIPSWQQHQDNARPFFRSLRSITYEPFDYRVEVLTPDVALWSGRYRYAWVDSLGAPTSGTSAQTWVFVRQPGGWRIRHIHISSPLTPGK